MAEAYPRSGQLIRAEARARGLVRAMRDDAFDQTTLREIRSRAHEVVVELQAFVDDQEFWSAMRQDCDVVYANDRLAQLAVIDATATARLLRLAGYECPPPPPAEHLVDDTVAALLRAADELRQYRRTDLLLDSQKAVIMFLQRVRRDLDDSPIDEGAIPRAARAAGRVARQVMPAVVGATGGALIEAAAPGAGLGLVAARPLQKAAEQLSERAAALLIGHRDSIVEQTGEIRMAFDGEPERESSTISGSLVELHVAALQDRIDRADFLLGRRDRVSEVRAVVESANMHRARAVELITDRSEPATPDVSADLRHATSALRSIVDEVHRRYPSSFSI